MKNVKNRFLSLLLAMLLMLLPAMAAASDYEDDAVAEKATTKSSWDGWYEDYVVTTASVNLRSGAGLDYRRVSTALSDSYFPYLGSTKYDWRGVAWYKVECSKGSAWISSRYSYLEGDGPVDEDYVEATASVNLRSGPSLFYEKLGSVRKGTTLDYLGRTKYDNRGIAWYKVDYYGEDAWISSRYSELY